MTSTKYAPPWKDLETGEQYGPKTIATYQRHLARFKNWAYHKPGPERQEAPLMHRFVAAMHAELPGSIMDIYRAVYVHRMSINETTEDSGLSRSTVRSYMRRLRERAEEWEKTNV